VQEGNSTGARKNLGGARRKLNWNQEKIRLILRWSKENSELDQKVKLKLSKKES
jgi:hypothetical protein